MTISLLSRLSGSLTDASLRDMTPSGSVASRAPDNVNTVANPSQQQLWLVTAAMLTQPMSEKQLLTRLFRLTRDMTTMRGLCSGLQQLTQATNYRLGYTMSATHELRWPLQITVQRNQPDGSPIFTQQACEPLAVINAGLAGNLRYQSGTTHRFFTLATPQTNERVLNHLRQQACQQHFL